MTDSDLVAELAKRLVGIAIISSDINDGDLNGKDMEALIGKITVFFENAEKPAILTREVLLLLEGAKDTKNEITVEIAAPLDFRPLAKETEENFMIRSVHGQKTDGTVADFTRHFSDRLEQVKSMIQSGLNNNTVGMLQGIEDMKRFTVGREIVIAGMVYEKSVTKNGHILVTVEDETGRVKVLFAKPSREVTNSAAATLFSSAYKIINDEVIAVRGKVSGTDFIIAKSLMYPGVPVHQRKKIEEDISIGFLSDIHVGSKLFMQKQFDRFTEWMNGKFKYRLDYAGRIKYVVVSGDLVDGIGVYPNQDRELAIDDIYLQYKKLFEMLGKIPEYVHIFLLTGNHDAVQRAEPQPELPSEFCKDFMLENMHLVSNPGYMTLHGMRILGYHGTSLDSVIQGIPGCSYSRPEEAMVEVLKRRHLSPIYGDNPIVPSKRDEMVIDQVPDILHMGHLHKNGYSEYHGTLIVNSGTWQSRTSYQVRLGHMPTPAVLPVYEAGRMELGTVDFNNVFE